MRACKCRFNIGALGTRCRPPPQSPDIVRDEGRARRRVIDDRVAALASKPTPGMPRFSRNGRSADHIARQAIPQGQHCLTVPASLNEVCSSRFRVDLSPGGTNG